ncbi:MAG: T9SS type A sorting domain-containing protein [Bacteroidaceae bacterium]|nr:T9SS type A sorting domain-containing protein [Bacteroidaceae bacterium]
MEDITYDAEYTFTVTSDISLEAWFESVPYGVEDADAEAVQVYATDGVIYINGYEGEVKVVNAAGQVVKDVMVNGAEQLNVNAGLYMVVTGNQVTKVVVK